jgi:hypothetical protein
MFVYLQLNKKGIICVCVLICNWIKKGERRKDEGRS